MSENPHIPLKIFIGMDRRQTVAFTVLSHSIYARATRPVSITPLRYDQLPVTRKGLTEFTFSRYLVPYLCDYRGWGLFIDADFLCLADISQLFELADPQYALQVVKNKLQFEWPSLMLFNCEACTRLTVDFIEKEDPNKLQWGSIGEIPAEWNFLVGYDDFSETPKMVHYTQGIPDFPEMKGTLFYDDWHKEKAQALDNCSWLELMSQSVHGKPVIERLEEKMKAFHQQ